MMMYMVDTRFFVAQLIHFHFGLRFMPMFLRGPSPIWALPIWWLNHPPQKNRNIFLEQPFLSSRATDSVGLVMVDNFVALVDGSLLIISSLVVVVHLLLALDMLQLPCGSSSLRSQFLARHVR